MVPDCLATEVPNLQSQKIPVASLQQPVDSFQEPDHPLRAKAIDSADKSFICGCPLRKRVSGSCSQAPTPNFANCREQRQPYVCEHPLRNVNPNMRLTAKDVVMNLRPTAMHEGTACGMYIFSRRLAATIILAVDRYMETRGGHQFTDSWSRSLVKPMSRHLLLAQFGTLCRIPQLPISVVPVPSAFHQMLQQQRPCFVLALVRLAILAPFPRGVRALPGAWAC